MDGCTDSELVYVTRLPPSSSGVAAYAQMFVDVLERIGEVQLLQLHPDPRESQTIAELRRVLQEARHARRTRCSRAFFVELAGRGIAEFWTAWWLSRRGESVIVTIHDVPAVSGGAFFFRALDRRGGRRVAALLSNTIGRIAERSLLDRATAVFTLSEEGSHSLQRVFGLARHVTPIPHVANSGETSVVKQKEIFFPGYISRAEDVFGVLSALEQIDSEWRLVVGALSASDEAKLAKRAELMGIAHRIEVLGFQDENELLASFDRAAVVVRWRVTGWSTGSGGGRYAVSGPIVRGLSRGCVVVTNDDRGVREFVGRVPSMLIPTGEGRSSELVEMIVTVANDDALRTNLGEAGREYMRVAHGAARIAPLVLSALS